MRMAGAVAMKIVKTVAKAWYSADMRMNGWRNAQWTRLTTADRPAPAQRAHPRRRTSPRRSASRAARSPTACASWRRTGDQGLHVVLRPEAEPNVIRAWMSVQVEGTRPARWCTGCSANPASRPCTTPMAAGTCWPNCARARWRSSRQSWSASGSSRASTPPRRAFTSRRFANRSCVHRRGNRPALAITSRGRHGGRRWRGKGRNRTRDRPSCHLPRASRLPFASRAASRGRT